MRPPIAASGRAKRVHPRRVPQNGESERSVATVTPPRNTAGWPRAGAGREIGAGACAATKLAEGHQPRGPRDGNTLDLQQSGTGGSPHTVADSNPNRVTADGPWVARLLRRVDTVDREAKTTLPSQGGVSVGGFHGLRRTFTYCPEEQD